MNTKSKSVLGIILKSIVVVATALASVFGFTSCTGR
ncbi:smalltalk protein [Bacteroides gallinarum]|nr:smalltalk protein [Bacteroides gallinarum]